MRIVGDLVFKSDYIRGAPGVSGARRGGHVARAMQKIVGGFTEEPEVVAIAGNRGGAAVVVEVAESLLNDAMRADAHRSSPKTALDLGISRGEERRALRVSCIGGDGRARLTAALKVCGAPSRLLADVRYTAWVSRRA